MAEAVTQTTLTFERKINVPAEAVYHAFTNTTAIREWLADGVQAQAQEGGRFYAWWNDGYYTSGEYTGLAENESVGFTWFGRGEPHQTQVTVSLAADGDATRLTLVHDGLGEGEAWEPIVTEFTRGWESGLENLISVLETGTDLRLARRPLLGIVPGDLINKENAAQYNLPPDAKGNVIGSVLEGYGSEAAGLQSGDVLHSIDGVVLENFPAYATAMAGKKAGDTVEVVYWRAGEQFAAPMTLSPRPMPEVPPDAGELSKAVEKVYAQVHDELAEILDGVSDEAAAKNPPVGGWSAKETLCHLILVERDTQMWLATLISGRGLTNFPDNIQSRIEALLAVYPALDDLRGELQRSHAETVRMLAELPAEFVARKGSYVRMGQGMLQGALHPQSHYEQIKAALGG